MYVSFPYSCKNNYNEYIVGLYDNLDKSIIEHYRDNSKFLDTIQNIQYVSQYTEQFWNYKNPKYIRMRITLL